MVDAPTLKNEVFAAIALVAEDKTILIEQGTPLLGGGSILDSMKLVELCLMLEDKAADLGFDFDWTSETALSKSRSMFRTAGALAEEFAAQGTAPK